MQLRRIYRELREEMTVAFSGDGAAAADADFNGALVIEWMRLRRLSARGGLGLEGVFRFHNAGAMGFLNCLEGVV